MKNTVRRPAWLARGCVLLLTLSVGSTGLPPAVVALAAGAAAVLGVTTAHANVLPDAAVQKPGAMQPVENPDVAPGAADQLATVQSDSEPEALDVIYESSATPLLWLAHGQPREVAYEALELLQRAPEHGLDPERYATERLYELIQGTTSEQLLTDFDQLLTAAIWSYSEDLRIGAAHERLRVRHRGHSKRNSTTADSSGGIDRAAARALVAAIRGGELRAHLEALPPVFAGYQQLQKALDTYNDYHLLGGWESLPTDLRLKSGDRHPAVGALRYRLVLTDGLSEDAVGSDVYDEPVQSAVERFQERHGLAVDGEIGPATLAALNQTSARKIQRISLNLARLRQLPRELPEDHIQVNIPEFKLRMYREAQESLSMGVVVGSRRTPTPAMQDKVRHLVFNPYWYPPRNIAVGEILPRLRRSPEYLEHTGFELLSGKTVVDASKINWQDYTRRNFPFRLRQLPGEKNSLGNVKFIFPNEQAIYLHDTPSRKLFAERVRAFSHGCIRLERPTELATALMEWDRGWTEEDVLADISAAKRKLRKFKQRMAIYLVYQTTRVTDGVIKFHPDIYGHDRQTSSMLGLAPLVAALLPGIRSAPAQEETTQQLAIR